MSDLDIQNRLDLLPPKTAMPFRQLLQAGQLDEEDLHVILDAGALAHDKGRLLGFAIAYLHFRSKHLPIHDVIRMAKNQKRRVNLSWSAKRWKEEHDRLSRAETLVRLAGNNTTYDLTAFEGHLPENFSGYVIRNSRRLGMEGLRQRHCVASYHDRILGGHCAILAMFVDDKRWTVELRRTDDLKSPLTITQIKTRYNGHAPESVRDEIHALLDIEKPKQPSYHHPQREYHYMDTLRRVLPVLREHRVECVCVEFDGSCDSGYVENVDFRSGHDVDLSGVVIEHTTTQQSWENGGWITRSEARQEPIKDVIKSLTDDYLDETGVDWYNDDGGFGELLIHVEAGTVELEINVRYTESTREYDVERDILTGEEL